MTENIRIKKYNFGNTSDNLGISLTVNEVLSPGSYGMYTWPSAVMLSEYIWSNKEQYANKNVLEIGAGTGLPGMLAAKCGSEVIISDSKYCKMNLTNCESACKINNIKNVSFMSLTWGLFHPDVIQLRNLDWIIGSDCLFDPKIFEEVMVTVAYLLSNNPRAKFVLAYQVRASDWSFCHLLSKYSLKCEIIPLSSFYNRDECETELTSKHKIILYEIQRDDIVPSVAADLPLEK